MTASKLPPDDQRKTGRGEAAPSAGWWGVAAGLVLAVLCCAAPVLIAAGALGALGTWLTNPWLLGTAGLLMLVVLIQTWRRYHHRRTSSGLDGQPPSAS